VFLCLLAGSLHGCGSGSSGDGIDPGIIEIPIAFIKRPIPLDDMGDEVQADLREPRLFSAGGDVYLRTNSTVNATVTNITRSVTGGTGDVKGLNASFDGTKLIFSLRLFDPDPNDDVVPAWNIYEYDVPTGTLRSVIPSAVIAEQGDDLHPAYLPDGRIVFTSSRQDQAQSNLINEGKQAFSALDEDENVVALQLHVMNADGTSIKQISQNQSHDLHPQVLENFSGGQIVFSRWDNAGTNDSIHLYKSNPDGSNLDLLYGRYSHDTGTDPGTPVHFSNIRELPNGDLMTIVRPFTDTFDGGDIVIINASQFADNDQAIWSLNGLGGPAQVSATVTNIPTDDSISVAGRYSSAFPLQDGSNRVLVSKSTCQLRLNGELRPCVDPYLSDPNAVEASPAYAIWLSDLSTGTEKPVILAEAGQVITEAVTVQTRLRPPVIFDKSAELNSVWVTENLGVINIKSVYDLGNTSFDGCFFGNCETSPSAINTVQDFADPLNAIAEERPARFVRFTRPVGIPDPDDQTLVDPPDLIGAAFGRQRNQGMREIVGYAPVEPDGSVMVKVPGNLPLAIEVLDAEGRRIGPRHQNWFQVLPGDTLTCNGCHTNDTGAATPEVHGRSDGVAPSINSGIPISLQYIRTLIPGTTLPYWSTNIGETMAEVRFARGGSAVPPAPEPTLTADLNFVDYWTDPAFRLPDVSYSYRYDDLDPSISTPAAPGRPLRNANCDNITPQAWRHNCRVTINYPRHIHAIWQLNRGAADLFTPLAPAPPPGDPSTPLLVDNMNTDGFLDDTCVTCHTTVMGTRIAYGQLDLTTDPNQDPADFYRAYRELFFNDDAQVLDAGLNIIEEPLIQIPSTMTANGARSSYFMEKMTGTELDAGRGISGTVDHSNMLTPAELKLIAEWLDLGGQNFNDPFDPAAPQN
ncbi:MAG: hypothetical protein AAF353_15125, partial [Pseudomonadota bacterium]